MSIIGTGKVTAYQEWPNYFNPEECQTVKHVQRTAVTSAIRRLMQ